MKVEWLELCRRAVSDLRGMFGDYPSAAKRALTAGSGAGGDRTLVIDAKAEEIVFSHLQPLADEGLEFTAISEERGTVRYGSGGSTWVLIDPIDGSLNAKRAVPYYSLSIAVASGARMSDVEFGFVYHFGAGEEFWAAGGQGAWLNGEQLVLPDSRSDGDLEVVSLEGARPTRTAQVAAALGDRVYRLRCMGSIALSLSYIAAGRFDGMISLYPCRSVDAAAGQLIAREAGATVRFLGQRHPLAASLDLDSRYICVAARARENIELLAESATA